MTADAFKVQYPEFRSAWTVNGTTDYAFLNAMLAAAASELSEPYWAEYYDQAHGLLTAHMLATSPNGQMARLQSEKAESTYGKAFLALRCEITFADRVF